MCMANKIICTCILGQNVKIKSDKKELIKVSCYFCLRIILTLFYPLKLPVQGILLMPFGRQVEPENITVLFRLWTHRLNYVIGLYSTGTCTSTSIWRILVSISGFEITELFTELCSTTVILSIWLHFEISLSLKLEPF